MNDSVVVSNGSAWALVPVKQLTEAKSRLAPFLSAAQREDLQCAMLADVLAALTRSIALEGVMVVTRDAAMAAFARERGAVIVDEPDGCAGLNVAVNAGIARLAERGAARALVVPADVPLVEVADIDRIVNLSRQLQLTLVVPSHDLGGTNGLLVHLNAPPEIAFGPDSFHRHLYSKRGRLPMGMAVDSFAWDVDTPSDLAALTTKLRGQDGLAPHTAAFARVHLTRSRSA